MSRKVPVSQKYGKFIIRCGDWYLRRKGSEYFIYKNKHSEVKARNLYTLREAKEALVKICHR